MEPRAARFTHSAGFSCSFSCNDANRLDRYPEWRKVDRVRRRGMGHQGLCTTCCLDSPRIGTFI